MMKFCWTTLRVSDFDKSLRFYRDLIGLPVAECSSHGGASIAMLGPEDGPKIELLYEADAPLQGQGDGISLGFEVGDLSYATRKWQTMDTRCAAAPSRPIPTSVFLFSLIRTDMKYSWLKI